MSNIDNEQYQVQQGAGVHVKAADLALNYQNRGIYRDLWRDFDWAHISQVTIRPDGKVDIEYLSLEESRTSSTEGNSTIQSTEYRATKHVQTVGKDDLVLICSKEVLRPRGRRIKVVTTTVTTEEPLDE